MSTPSHDVGPAGAVVPEYRPTTSARDAHRDAQTAHHDAITDLALIDGRVERGEDVEPDTRIQARERVAILAAKVDALRPGADAEELVEQRTRWRDQREVLDVSKREAQGTFYARYQGAVEAITALLAAGRAFDDVRMARRSLGPEPGAGPDPVGPRRPITTDPDGIVASAVYDGLGRSGRSQSLLAGEMFAMGETVDLLRWLVSTAPGQTAAEPVTYRDLLSEPVGSPMVQGTVQHGGVRNTLAAVGR